MTTSPVIPPTSVPPPGVKPDPIRIKLYGIFTVTRRSYLTQLVIAGVLLVILAILPGFVPPLEPGPRVQVPDGVLRVLALLKNLPWIALGLAVLFGVEASFVLRRFRREEARRQTPSSPPPGGESVSPTNQP